MEKGQKKIKITKNLQRLIRENLLFNYEVFIKENLNFKNNLKNVNMLTWFVGFVEAQSYNCWFVDKKVNRQSFFLKYNNIIVLYKIKKLLGFGKVKIYYEKKQIIYYKYIVNSKKGSYLLLLLFNENLLLNLSRKNFYYYFKFICKKFLINFNFNFNINKGIKLKADAWLSGFCDMRCIFFFNKKQKKLQIFLKLFNVNEYNLLSSVFVFEVSGKKFCNDVFLINNNINELISYFSKYPLYTKKNLDFIRFKKIKFRLDLYYTNQQILNQRRAKKRFKRLIAFLNKNNILINK